MNEKLWGDFEGRMRDLRELRSAASLLGWDQETCLPPRASEARGRQVAVLEAVIHERLCDPRLADTIAALAGEALPPDRAAMVRQLSREAERARKLPEAWVRALARAQSAGLAAWRQAREAHRFDLFAPALGKLLALRREQADLLGHGGVRYDALLDIYEPGARVAALQPLFARLSTELRRLAEMIAGSGRRTPAIEGRFEVARQETFCRELVTAMGFDLTAGRLDRSAHPFTLGVHPTDVRLTNRYREDDPRPAIFGAIHECGHGLYEQGFAPVIAGTSLADAPSFGLHESQSRLWENLVGRSLPFWRAFFPGLQRLFPEALGNLAVEEFHAAVNGVGHSPVRVEADEVTYNLHIALRLALEAAMIAGDLEPAELPGAWNETSRRLLGFSPRDDVEGVLQDIHWAWGDVGYFPSYTLGNLYAAILLDAAEREIPNLWERVSHGELLPLREWLRRKIHAPGRQRDTEETVRAATGEGLSERPFLAYLWAKYGELYGLARGR